MEIKLYHTTRKDLVPKIKEEGLVPKRPFARPDKLKGIYLSKFPFKWMFNSTLEQTPGALITIDATGLKLLKDIHTDKRDMDIDCEGDFVCLQTIKPERIIEIAVEVKRGCFEKCKQ
jgi:sensor domain CHASE-containing protein